MATNPKLEELDRFSDVAWENQRHRYEYWKSVGFAPKTALDVGACIGQWSRMIKSVWPDILITQIEPDPRCEEELMAQGNEYHMVALSNTTQEQTFYYGKPEDPTYLGNSSLYLEATGEFKKNGYEERKIQTYTADFLFPNRKFDLVKLDTQGSELDILAGGWATFSKTPMIQIECSLLKYNIGAPIFADCVAYMKGRYGMDAIDVLQVHYMTPGPMCVQMDLLFGRFK